MQYKEVQNLKYTFLISLVVVIFLVLFRFFVFPEKKVQIIEPPFNLIGGIDWALLRNKLLVEEPVFSLKAKVSNLTPEEQEKVSLSVEIGGTLKGAFQYSFDCQNDGIFELETEFIEQRIYTAFELCSFTKPGNFKAKIKVKPKEDGLAEKSSLIDISVVSKNKPPSISFCDVSPSKGTNQKSFIFSFTAEARDPEGEDVSYFWDFGDGATSSEANPKHSFQQAGGYVPKVIVTDKEGASTVCVVQSLLILNDFTPVLSAKRELDPGR
ncbi:PKD domain-containing protein, partial [Candidatus Gribaldobacteria bacterium]|nr:PKD domain-containing protein [Candidatus Gribaldobacteria bacterium]